MKAIIFFGGAPYSGKSTIINNIANTPSNTSEFYSFDNARNYIITNQSYFFTALDTWSQIFKAEFLRLFAISKHKDIVMFLLEVNNASRDSKDNQNAFLYQFTLLKDYSALTYITKQMLSSKADYFIIEANFLNKNLRKATYDLLAHEVEDFKSTPKYFFYMNLPLKILLRRKDKRKIRKEKSEQVKKTTIKRKFLAQEVINPNELEEVEIHIIKSIKESNNIPNIIFNH